MIRLFLISVILMGNLDLLQKRSGKTSWLKFLSQRWRREMETYGKKRALLITDGHGSRGCDRCLKKLRKAKVDVLVQPAFSSHITCALDAICFGTYKNLMSSAPNTKNWKQMLKFIWNAMYRALSPEAIFKGFKVTGVHPLCFAEIGDTIVFKDLPEKKKKRVRKRFSINNKIITKRNIIEKLRNKRKKKKKKARLEDEDVVMQDN